MIDIKLIIFDLDGTFYNLNDVVEMNYIMQVDFYSSYRGINRSETIEVFKQHDIYPNISKKSKSATEFFAKNGIPSEQWNIYRESNFNVRLINREAAISGDLISKFKNICPLILLSSNSFNNISKILDYINISTNLFEEIICSDSKHGIREFNKKDEMALIAKNRNMNIASILSIGDRYETDIKPILELGGMGIIVEKPKDLFSIYSSLTKKDFSNIHLYKNKIGE